MQQKRHQMACHTTPRLEALRAALCRVDTVADIGCDHAYLPILLAQQGCIKKIIATDVREGPLAKARQNISRFGLSDIIETRLGSGLAPLKPGEANAIVIAGMGAGMISNILHEGEQTAKNANLLVLQPMSAVPQLRRFLYQNGYTIEREVLVQEEARIYTIIFARSGITETFSELDCYISPALRAERPPLYTAYVKKIELQLQIAVKGMQKAQTKSGQMDTFKTVLLKINQLTNLGR